MSGSEPELSADEARMLGDATVFPHLDTDTQRQVVEAAVREAARRANEEKP